MQRVCLVPVADMAMHFRMLAPALIVAVVSTASVAATVEPAPTASEVIDLQRRARARMRSIQYELAIPLLERALKGKVPRPMRAELSADLGICHASLGDVERARVAFDRALSANVLLDLPVGTAPKIRQLFELTRAQHSEPTAQPRDGPAAVTHDGPAGPPPAAASGFAPKPVDYALAAIAVGGVLAGLLTGVVSSNAAIELQSGIHDRAVVDRLDARRFLFGASSVASYTLAGAAALTELFVLLFVDHRPAPSPVAVRVGVLPNGAFAWLQLRL